MYLPGEHGARFDSLTEQCTLLQSQLSPIAFPSNRNHFLPGSNLGEVVMPGDVMRIESGVVYINYGNRTLAIMQAGDLICPLIAPVNHSKLNFVAEEKVSASLQTAERWLATLVQTPDALQAWYQLQLVQQRLFMELYGENIKTGVRPQAGFLRFGPGELILHEGDEADCAFTLLKGRANVSIGNRLVGVVEEGEIFGALAVLNKTQRNASVYAKTPCTVMAVPAEQFIDLVEAHPETSLRLIRSMARQIEELNSRVTHGLPSSL
ncbi:MAG: cyclic nucleotide-binding domain-containing protein [Hahellaceae bacterium]|nr:cyclic nucleotide-binding domain-containing protein [Hahellaceae bacterium]MCP5168503.1 cyclic nucleotide-binding domain-containing protein [Hahellaceae bacterium]